MSSRRSAQVANTLIFCREAILGLDQAYTTLKLLTPMSLEVGLLCGYPAHKKKSPAFVQCAIPIPNPALKLDNGKTKLPQSQEEWLEVLDDRLIRSFASKVHRMLCGGTQILGLYFIASAEIMNSYITSFETILKALWLDRTTTAVSTSTFYLSLISLGSGAMSHRRCTFTERNASPTVEGIQFRVSSRKQEDLVRVNTTWKLDLLLPIKRSIAGEHEQRFNKTLLKVLTEEIHRIESAIVVDVEEETIVEELEQNSSSWTDAVLKLGPNDQNLPSVCRAIDEIGSGSSRSSRSRSKKEQPTPPKAEESRPLLEKNVLMFTRHQLPHERTSFEVHQVASGALRLRGSMLGVAFVPKYELQNGDFARLLRLDLVKSLQSRVACLFEDISKTKQSLDKEEDAADKPSLGRAKNFRIVLPRRIALKMPVQQAYFCDYLLSNEDVSDLKAKFSSTLSLVRVTTNKVKDGVRESSRPSQPVFELDEWEHEAAEQPWTDEELASIPTDVAAPRHRSNRANARSSRSKSATEAARQLVSNDAKLSKTRAFVMILALIGVFLAVMATWNHQQLRRGVLST